MPPAFARAAAHCQAAAGRQSVACGIRYGRSRTGEPRAAGSYTGNMVGVERFELPTLWSQTRCATRLRYAPKLCIVTDCGSVAGWKRNVFRDMGVSGGNKQTFSAWLVSWILFEWSSLAKPIGIQALFLLRSCRCLRCRVTAFSISTAAHTSRARPMHSPISSRDSAWVLKIGCRSGT